MPKRVIDGDALWVSEKLASVPAQYRAEYAWLLPLAQANGCFECSPMLVWRTCYSALRPEWSIETVAAMLAEFEAAKMLFRWKDNAGKTFGLFIGVQKEGRLPPPSERVKSAKQWQAGMLPEKELAQFLGVSVKQVREDYRELLSTYSRPTLDKRKRKSSTGIGIGIGSGVGNGSGEGNGVGNGYGSGEGNGDITATLNTSSATLPITSSLQHLNTATLNTKTLPFDAEGNEDEQSSSSFDGYTAIKFGRLFLALMRENPNATAPPKGWETAWVEDFKRLLGFIPASELADVIAVSQLDKNKQFYVRPAKLIDNLSLLQQMIQERKNVMPKLRSELRNTADRLGV